MEFGEIRYTDNDEALRLVHPEPDEQGRYIWKGVIGGDYRVISADYLNTQPRTPQDVLIIIDGKGGIWTDSFKTQENLQELAQRWDQTYPKSAPHKVGIFTFKEWV